MRDDKIDFYNLDNGGGAYIWNDDSFKQDRVVKLINELKVRLSANAIMNVLDIGSGTGDFIYRLSSLFPKHHYYGCDVAINMIVSNRITKKDIIWDIEDFNRTTNYKDNFFDIVVAGEVVEHLYDTDNFLRKLSEF
jgi:ubiquinone/menaquinone biosynthesis C-methylase UbiE